MLLDVSVIIHKGNLFAETHGHEGIGETSSVAAQSCLNLFTGLQLAQHHPVWTTLLAVVQDSPFIGCHHLSIPSSVHSSLDEGPGVSRPGHTPSLHKGEASPLPDPLPGPLQAVLRGSEMTSSSGRAARAKTGCPVKLEVQIKDKSCPTWGHDYSKQLCVCC